MITPFAQIIFGVVSIDGIVVFVVIVDSIRLKVPAVDSTVVSTQVVAIFGVVIGVSFAINVVANGFSVSFSLEPDSESVSIPIRFFTMEFFYVFRWFSELLFEKYLCSLYNSYKARISS